MLDHDTVVDEKSYETYDQDFIYCLRRVREITDDKNLVLCIDKIFSTMRSSEDHT
ncbi:MAG: hypothetical protein R6U17_04425 [Thermoplasmata archaeon]